jgi:RHS repeat-associated core domain
MEWYLSDHLGSTTLLINESGVEVERTEYYPYGEVQSGGLEKYGFTGQENDADTELMYYGARYYSPEFRIFVQPDTMLPDLYNPQALNRYSYCLNNPVKYNDPSGHHPAVAALATAALVAVTTVLDVAMLDYSYDQYKQDPNVVNGAYLTWDLMAAALPHVPGSYIVRAPRLVQYAWRYTRIVHELPPMAKLFYKVHEFGTLQGANFATNRIVDAVCEFNSGESINTYFSRTFGTNSFNNVDLSDYSEVSIRISGKWVSSIKDPDGYYLIGINEGKGKTLWENQDGNIKIEEYDNISEDDDSTE